VFALGALNSVRMSNPWPGAGAAQAVAARAAALRKPVGEANRGIAFRLDSVVACQVFGELEWSRDV
jgi:peptidoglycan hydrolase-like amidase